MHMSVIWGISIVLACLPSLMAVFFLTVTLQRKKVAVKQDLQLLSNTPSGPIDELMNKFYGAYTISAPAILLTLFYAAWIALGDAYLNQKFNSGTTWFFPKALVDQAAPVLYTFVGVYLFNLGDLLRRLYLGDLNEQVFWGAINRLWLSLGLGIVVLKAGLKEAAIFFSIGFIANIILEWVLDKTLKALNWNQPKSDDLPLQMVKGINIWKAYRLEEESIENVQNLATANVTELAVRTHYNFRTLIDWIDQALLLVRLTSDQAKALNSQATAISAIEMAAASPRATGNDSVAKALATVLKINPVLMGATMDRLYEDQCVQDLWNLWQSGHEGGALPAPSVPSPLRSGPPAAAAATAGAGTSSGTTPSNP